MASTEREPIMRVWGGAPVGSRGRAPGQRVRGTKPPEAESFLRIGHPKEGADWWSDCYECDLESFLVWYTTEDSFIIGADVAKSWGAQKSESLGV